MTTTTFVQLVDAVQALSVTGVTRHYDYPPESISTADLPALWPMPGAGGLPSIQSSCIGIDKTRTIPIFIAIEPVAQGTNSQNYEALPPIMDALETALDGMTVADFVEYELDSGTVFAVAEIQYWGVTATVTTRNR